MDGSEQADRHRPPQHAHQPPVGLQRHKASFFTTSASTPPVRTCGDDLESQPLSQPPMSEGTFTAPWPKSTNSQTRMKPGTLPSPNVGKREPSLPAKVGRRFEKIQDTGECCFVCFHQKKDFAIKVSTPKLCGETEVYRQLRQAIFKHHGAWKIWLPFYGINNAQEIKFVFDDVMGKDGRIPISVTEKRTEAEICHMLKTAHKTIADRPSVVDYEHGNACGSASEHTTQCLESQEFGYICIHKRLEEAKERIHGIRHRHWIKESLQFPSKAERRPRLNGMLQESFVYRSSERGIILPTDGDELIQRLEMRGLYVSLGWQFGGVLGLSAAWAFFGIAVVWLGTIAWAGPEGDWSTAMAFGQLIAACFALLFQYTCDSASTGSL